MPTSLEFLPSLPHLHLHSQVRKNRSCLTAELVYVASSFESRYDRFLVVRFDKNCHSNPKMAVDRLRAVQECLHRSNYFDLYGHILTKVSQI